MSERVREATLIVIVLALIVGGIVFDASARDVSFQPEVEPQGERFVEQASYCPPSLEGARSKVRLAIASTSENEIPVAIEPALPRPFDLGPEQALLYSPDDGAPLTVVGFGSAVVAGAMTSTGKRVAGAGAASCARSASREWYFAEGSSALGYDERLLIFNPFPFEAVVKVVFVTRNGEEPTANLSDVAVPAGGWTSVRVNNFILRHSSLAAKITALRGRVVAWRMLLASPEHRPEGVQLTLGAPAPNRVWYFPEGGTGGRYEERLSVLNPTEHEANVTISLSRTRTAVQPEALVEVAIPPRTVRSFPLKGRNQQATSAIVRSVNEVEVVAERTVWYSGKQVAGTTSEVGATQASRSWLVPPAISAPASDSVVVLNPSPADARVSITLIGSDGPVQPARLADIRVRAGLRIAVSLSRWIDSDAVIAKIDSDQPVVVERVASAAKPGHVASVLGHPLAR